MANLSSLRNDSRLRLLSKSPEPTGRIPRPRRAGRILSGLSGFRQRYDRLHWRGPAEIQYVCSHRWMCGYGKIGMLTEARSLDEPGREDE